MTDPTNVIDSPQRADVLAHAMLRLAPDPSPRCWQWASRPVLGVLLYAASAGQSGGGIGWVASTVAALAVDGGDAASAAGIIDPAARRVLRGLDGLCAPQRASIIETLRGAVAPWLATGRVRR
jgi:hypothetical protein